MPSPPPTTTTTTHTHAHTRTHARTNTTPTSHHPLQFFRLGKLKAFDPSEVYQPDTRLRLGVGVKAAGVGGKTVSAGGPACTLAATRGGVANT